jgi:hypothetical protein
MGHVRRPQQREQELRPWREIEELVGEDRPVGRVGGALRGEQRGLGEGKSKPPTPGISGALALASGKIGAATT